MLNVFATYRFRARLNPLSASYFFEFVAQFDSDDYGQHFKELLIVMLNSIFIVGTGRSGTHFTCRSISGFENIFDPLNGTENVPVLKQIATSAIHHRSYPEAAKSYYSDVKSNLTDRSIFIDQHHPNIFYCPELIKIFSNPIFLFPHRSIVQVVASMLNHQGVLNWYKYARDSVQANSKTDAIPFPNQFLGLAEFSQLDDLELHQICALRVISHEKMANRMQESGADLRFINYENLVTNQFSEYSRVFSKSELAALGEFSIVEESSIESLGKYKEVLTDKQISEVFDLVKLNGL